MLSVMYVGMTSQADFWLNKKQKSVPVWRIKQTLLNLDHLATYSNIHTEYSQTETTD